MRHNARSVAVMEIRGVGSFQLCGTPRAKSDLRICWLVPLSVCRAVLWANHILSHIITYPQWTVLHAALWTFVNFIVKKNLVLIALSVSCVSVDSWEFLLLLYTAPQYTQSLPYEMWFSEGAQLIQCLLCRHEEQWLLSTDCACAY